MKTTGPVQVAAQPSSLRLTDAAWTFVVLPKEMLLILKALGGRLREDEYDAAEELGNRLTAQRIRELRETADKLESSMAGDKR